MKGGAGGTAMCQRRIYTNRYDWERFHLHTARDAVPTGPSTPSQHLGARSLARDAQHSHVVIGNELAEADAGQRDAADASHA